MLWETNKVLDRQTGNILYVKAVLPLQPELHRSIYRVSVSPHEIGFKDLKTVLVTKIGGNWFDFGPSPDLLGKAAHPFLNEWENEYVAVARQILKTLGGQYDLRISLNTQDDEDHLTAIIGEIQFVPNGLKQDTNRNPDESAFDHIPGMRIIERCAKDFADTMGVTDDGFGGLNGEFKMNISADRLCIEYAVDSWALEISSDYVGSNDGHGVWAHQAYLTAPDNTGQTAGSDLLDENPSALLMLQSNDSPFNESFPKFLLGQVGIIEAERIDDNLCRYILEAGGIR